MLAESDAALATLFVLLQTCDNPFVNVIAVDPGSAVPPFEQVRTQIASAIDGGALPPATRLPTVRQLAADLGLAVNTVARSYRELELAGLIETRGRQGTFVAGAPSESRGLAVRAAREFTRRMQDLGIGEAESLAIVRREIEARTRSAQPRPQS